MQPTLCIEARPTAQTVCLNGVPINLSCLAESSGVDLGYISKVLSGKRRPSLSTATAITKALGMTSIEALLEAIESGKVSKVKTLHE